VVGEVCCVGALPIVVAMFLPFLSEGRLRRAVSHQGCGQNNWFRPKALAKVIGLFLYLLVVRDIGGSGDKRYPDQGQGRRIYWPSNSRLGSKRLRSSIFKRLRTMAPMKAGPKPRT